MKILFFDLETTGLSYWKHGIHQIAGIIEIDGKIEKEFDFKVAPNPAAKIDQIALDIGGVTVEQIKKYPSMDKIYIELTDIFQTYIDKFDKKDKFHLSGYNNANFDDPFLRAFFVQNNDPYFGSYFHSGPLDVYILAADHLKNERHKIENLKLGTVAKYLGIEVNEEKLHDGLYDVKLTYEIYKLIKQQKHERL